MTKVVRREGPLSWQGVCTRPRSWSWPWLTRSTAPSRNCLRSSPQWWWTTRSSRRSERASKRRNCFSGPRGFLPDKRREDPHRRAQQQGACGCSPYVHEEPGGRLHLRREAHGRQGHGDASKAVQGRDDLPETPASTGAKVARLVKTAAVPSLICGSDVTGMPLAQLNEARLIARKICSEKTYHCCLEEDLLLEDAGSDCGRRGVTSAILMWQCAWVERWVPALWMTKTLLAASERLRDCINPWKLVNGPVSAVVASMMRSLGRTKGVLSFASVGHGALRAVLQDAHDRRTWERAYNPALALVGGPPLVAPLKLAMQHLRTSGEHLARGALQFVFLGTMRTQNLEWLERISRLWARCGTDVTSPSASAEFRCGPPPGLRTGQMARPHAAVGSGRYFLGTTHAGGLLVRPGHSQARQARARRLGGTSRER